MEQSLHLPSKGKLRNNKRKGEKKENLIITHAYYLGGYKILLVFSDGLQRIINFEPLFEKFVKGYYNKFLRQENFKKFILENGNIFWGKNEEVIFPVSLLYSSRFGISQKEEVLYVL